MNRRNFIQGLLTAAAGFVILPPATTYSRVWRAERPALLPPAYLTRADIRPFTREDFENAEFKELNMDRVFQAVWELRRERGTLNTIDIIPLADPGLKRLFKSLETSF